MSRTYKYHAYSIRLTDTGRTDRDGKHIVAYRFAKQTPGAPLDIIMQGDDLHCSPLHSPEGPHTAASVLAFAGHWEFAETDARLAKYQQEEEETDNLFDWQERLDNRKDR